MARSPHGFELLSYDLCFAVAVAAHVPASFFCYLIGAPTADRGLVADCSDSLLKCFAQIRLTGTKLRQPLSLRR